MKRQYALSVNMLLKRQAHYILLLTAILLLVSSLLVSDSGKSVDVHLHDAYFVMAHVHIVAILGILVLAIWILYLSTGKLRYSKLLTRIHVGLSSLSLIALSISLLSGNGDASLARNRHYDAGGMNWLQDCSLSVKVAIVAVLLFLLVQFVYIINLFVGIVKKLINRNS